MEQPRPDIEAAAFRLTIITSFLLGATMVTLSLNTSILKQTVAAGALETTQWLLAVSLALMLFSTLVMLFMCYVILASMPLAMLALERKLRRIDAVRTLVATSAFLIIASYGSTFLVSLGLTSPWSWVLAAIAYGSGILWVIARWYYLARFVNPSRHAPT